MPLNEIDVAVIVAGVFVILACLITLNSIRLHIKNSKQPLIRNYTIRILLMIPVYGIEAWFAIYFPEHALMFRVLREGYEAFVILSFMQLMLTYLGGPVALARDMAAKKRVTKHLPPLCCVKPWMGARFVRLTLIGTLQYVPASLLVMAVSLSTWFTGHYKEGEVSNAAWVFCAVVTNCSQMWALYCLVLFYQATKDELKPIRPLPKFLCVKLIIFFTWWQGIVINTATHYKWVKLSNDPLVEERGESQLQNFIICIEMFFLAVCHSYAFPSEEFSIAHNPRSRAAVLADQWASKQGESFGPDANPSSYNRHGDHKRSPRSLPVRMVKSVGKAVNRRVERLQRFGSGVVATTGDMMSGVNLFDIWRVLRQTQELDAMAAADVVVDFDKQHRKDLESNNGLGSPIDIDLEAQAQIVGDNPGVLKTVTAQGGVAMEASPLHQVLITQSERRADQSASSSESTDRLIVARSPQKGRRPSASAEGLPSTKKELAAAWDLV